MTVAVLVAVADVEKEEVTVLVVVTTVVDVEVVVAVLVDVVTLGVVVVAFTVEIVVAGLIKVSHSDNTKDGSIASSALKAISMMLFSMVLRFLRANSVGVTVGVLVTVDVVVV